MKITFIATVFNEEKTINQFLESVLTQTKLPDEVIIVDGGSTDKTSELVNGVTNPRVKFYKKKGNRSVGRNEATRRASGDIIVCSDAGCILDKNWIKELTAPFADRTIEVVAGYYKPLTYTIFEKCLATYTCIMPDRVDKENFLPSSRSIAFRKHVWQEIGGYPEYLDTCEDLVFAKNLKSAGYSFKFAEKAIVFWPQRKTLAESFHQFYQYAVGDGRARYFRPQTPMLFLRYSFGFILVAIIFYTKSFFFLAIVYLLLSLYVIWAVIKNYHYVENWQAYFILPILQFTADIAVMLGTIRGLLIRNR